MHDSLSRLLRNASQFAEKAHQIEPQSVVAFGIAVESRYGKVGEMIEMLHFALAAASEAGAHHVKKVFYDSKAGICSFELHDSVSRDNEVGRMLYTAAKDTISAFLWFDDEHRN